MAKYVEKITKKERERKSPQNDQKIQGKMARTQKLPVQINVLKFCLVVNFGHRVKHTKFQLVLLALSHYSSQ